jgi:hypothetical protein
MCWERVSVQCDEWRGVGEDDVDRGSCHTERTGEAWLA